MQQQCHVCKLPDEPILVVTNEGILSPKHYDFRVPCAAIAEMLEAHQMPYTYLISDDRRLSVPDFDSFAAVITDALQNVRGPGSPSDPRVRGGAIVADHQGLRLWSDFLGSKDLYNLAMPVFEDMDDALAYVRRIAQETSQSYRTSSAVESPRLNAGQG